MTHDEEAAFQAAIAGLEHDDPGCISQRVFPGEDPVHVVVRAFEAEIHAQDGWDGPSRLAMVCASDTEDDGTMLKVSDLGVHAGAGNPLPGMFKLVTDLRLENPFADPAVRAAYVGTPIALLLSFEVRKDDDHAGAVDARVTMYLDCAARRIIMTRERDAPAAALELLDYERPHQPVVTGALPVLSAVTTEAIVLIREGWNATRQEEPT